MVFVSTTFLYPSREILQAELDAANHYKLKPSEFTTMITSKTGEDKKNLLEHGGKQQQHHYDTGDDGDALSDTWTESPLASSFIYSYFVLNSDVDS